MRYRPTEAQLIQMKQPMGKLLKGNPAETMPELANLVKKTRPTRVATVGDVVSRETIQSGIEANLRIIDHKTMRRPLAYSPTPSQHVFSLVNASGTISEDAFSIIRTAMSYEDALIVVDGEEDLLTIPAVLESPENSIVLYGQPMQGIVVISVTSTVKLRMRNFLDAMIQEN
jgi:uncharacterized protein (UPF0218 family)